MTNRYLAIIEETAYGTTPAGTKMYIDAEEVSLQAASAPFLKWGGMAGRVTRESELGHYFIEGDATVPVDAVSIGWFLKWFFGQVTTTTLIAGVQQHVFTPAALNHSFTCSVGKDHFEHTFAGCIVTDMEIEVENEFATAKINMFGQKDSKTVLAASPAFTEVQYFTYLHTTATIAAVSVPITSLAISLENNPDTDATKTIGSRYPQKIAKAGDLVAKISMDLTFDNTTHLERFWGGATGPADTITYFPMLIKMEGKPIAATTHNYTLSFDMPRVLYIEAQQTVSGRDAIIQSLELEVYTDKATGNNITATLKNAHMAY